MDLDLSLVPLHSESSQSVHARGSIPLSGLEPDYANQSDEGANTNGIRFVSSLSRRVVD